MRQSIRCLSVLFFAFCLFPLTAAPPVIAQSSNTAKARFDAERMRREMEWKRREMEKKNQARRREIEARIAEGKRRAEEIRRRMKNPSSSGQRSNSLPEYRSPSGQTTTIIHTNSPPPSQPSSRSSFPDAAAGSGRDYAATGNSAARSDKSRSLFPHERSDVQYNFRRGQELAYYVRMDLVKKNYHKFWVGQPYLLCIYGDDQDHACDELLCVGELQCYITMGDQQVRVANEDIKFPVHFRFIGVGVVNSEKPSFWKDHMLPYQMSVMLPIEELLFPDLPWWKDEPKTSTGSCTLYESGGHRSKKLNGETHREQRIESAGGMPRLINERRFYCKEEEIGLGYTQVSMFNKAEGAVTDTDLKYDLQFHGNYHIDVKIRRLRGGNLVAARTAAMQAYPPSEWPVDLKRVPATVENPTGWIRSVDELRPGQPVIYSHLTETRNAKYKRKFRAKVVQVISSRKARVRLDGSNEEFDAFFQSIYLR